ncbi:DNA-binding transcriptional regulator, AcrR family [Actinomyces ruminicola]|uniref:DNA-binding transcriptional regulator, AcrR family n=1 Tax=Actinomyces ruminicola TaxID=332524 RepID=A0A1H0ATH2_9ACTO|nr:TetR family transcriptional regulator [Actinomyces ruminicola]SDN36635.1 DNA-binding transcriptional regulator, AcrR family [Actinomyces ruminicola]
MSDTAAPRQSHSGKLLPTVPITPAAGDTDSAPSGTDSKAAPTRRRGPRSGSRASGSETTREAILDAARASFLAKGFAKTTIRGVARAAGVDPALVSYYFGSKGDLFGASMNLRIRASEEIAKVVSGDIRTAGPRLVRLAMTAWDDSSGGATFRALLRWVATDDGAPEAVQTYATEQIATPVMQALEQVGVLGPDARERATLAASQLVGLAMIRYTFQVEPVASASVDHLVEVVGPTIQHYLTGPLLRR